MKTSAFRTYDLTVLMNSTVLCKVVTSQGSPCVPVSQPGKSTPCPSSSTFILPSSNYARFQMVISNSPRARLQFFCIPTTLLSWNIIGHTVCCSLASRRSSMDLAFPLMIEFYQFRSVPFIHNMEYGRSLPSLRSPQRLQTTALTMTAKIFISQNHRCRQIADKLYMLDDKGCMIKIRTWLPATEKDSLHTMISPAVHHGKESVSYW